MEEVIRKEQGLSNTMDLFKGSWYDCNIAIAGVIKKLKILEADQFLTQKHESHKLSSCAYVLTKRYKDKKWISVYKISVCSFGLQKYLVTASNLWFIEHWVE